MLSMQFQMSGSKAVIIFYIKQLSFCELAITCLQSVQILYKMINKNI